MRIIDFSYKPLRKSGTWRFDVAKREVEWSYCYHNNISQIKIIQYLSCEWMYTHDKHRFIRYLKEEGLFSPELELYYKLL